MSWNIQPVIPANEQAEDADVIDRRDPLQQALVYAKEMRGLYEGEKNRADNLETAFNALQLAVEKVTEAERIREQFLANCSHELRTPLTPIIGWAKHLSTKDVTAEDVKEFASTIVEQGERLMRIVDSLLRAATIQSARDLQLRLREVDVSTLLEEAASPARQIHRSVEVDVGTDASTVVTERAYLAEAVTYLVDNAMKFSPDATPIRLEARRNEGELILSVIDNGAGVPESERSRIFGSFTQIDGSTTRKHGGLGVGLYLCRQLVLALGGRIWHEETPGGGSTFRVALPIPG